MPLPLHPSLPAFLYRYCHVIHTYYTPITPSPDVEVRAEAVMGAQ